MYELRHKLTRKVYTVTPTAVASGRYPSSLFDVIGYVPTADDRRNLRRYS